MTRGVLMQSSTGSTSNSSPTRKANDGLYLHSTLLNQPSTNNPTFHNIPSSVAEEEEEEEEVGGERKRRRQQQQQQQRQQREEEEEDEDEAEREYQFQLNDFVGFFLTAFRKSVLGCSSCEINSSTTSICSSRGSSGSGGSGGGAMEIGVPTNVRHVAHVTFDRFNGFLGLPLEFEPHVPTRPPSASTTVFGVSTNSMQLSFDTRGNSVPTILLMMQHRLYALGGLQAEGIFRINPDNGQEESVREQLNRGLLPEDVDVHSLAGLIKAWFRELPTGVLDCLSPEQVMQSQTEQECTELARLLPPTEFALLDWAINLMADVAQFEHLNKMNARNIAMVFAPNMTHMTDPLTALMHAVQVMNFLKTLIEKTLREREDSIIESALDYFNQDPYGGNGHHFSLQTIIEEASEPDAEEERDSTPVNPSALDQGGPSSGSFGPGEDQPSSVNCEDDEAVQEEENISLEYKNRRNNSAKLEGAKQTCTPKKAGQKGKERCIVQAGKSNEKAKGRSLVNSMNLRSERIEAWR